MQVSSRVGRRNNSRPLLSGLFLAAWSFAACIPSARSSVASASEWQITQPRGKVRQIDFDTSEGSWMSLDVSADGKWIVFDLLGHIYRMPARGGVAQCLTQDSGIAVNFHPRFSPDGRSIAFVSERGGFHNLWTMNVDGTAPRPLATEQHVVVGSPAWSRNSRSLVAQRLDMRTADSSTLGLWRYTLDGAAPVRVTDEKTASASGAAFSPDGKHVYFHYFAGRDPVNVDLTIGDYRIARLDLSTGKREVVTSGIAPSVSPDGRWLAFAKRLPDQVFTFKGHVHGPRNTLWLRDLSTGAERQLMEQIDPDIADGGNINESPTLMPGYAWTADSAAVVIAQGGKIRRVRVSTAGVETVEFRAKVRRTISEQVRIERRVSDGPVQARMMRWMTRAPDGKQLVFQALGRLWLADEDGGNVRRLTADDSNTAEHMPVWSTDGRWVAFVTRDGLQSGHVWKVPAQGGAPQRLTQIAGTYVNPLWSRDGATVWFAARCEQAAPCATGSRVGSYNLWRIAATGDGVVELVSAMDSSEYAPPVLTRGPEDRIYFTEQVDKEFDLQTRLVSVTETGTDRRVHLIVPYAEVVTPSLDGRWVALEKRSDVFLVPYEASAAQREVTRSDLYDNNGSGVRRLTTQGGKDPRWLDVDRLQFGGPTYSVHKISTGRTRSVAVRAQLPRYTSDRIVAITGARIVTLNDRAVIESGDIVVRGSRIACVGKCDLSGVQREIDARGATIIPGFVDMHGGLAEPVDQLSSAHHLGAAMPLAFGTTTAFAPSNKSATFVYSMAELIERGVLPGPRLFAATDYFRSDNNARTSYVEVRNFAEANNEAARNAAYGAVALKNLTLTAAAERQQLAEAARANKLAISGHLETGFFEYGLSLAMEGYTGSQHVPVQVPLYDDAARFFGQAGFGFNVTMGLMGSVRNDGFFFQESEYWKDPKILRFTSPTEAAFQRNRRRELRAPSDYPFPLQAQFVADATAYGARGSIGTHGPGYRNHWEIRMLAAGLGPMGALEAASLNGARFLGMERDLGSIEVGKLADLLILDANPLDDIRNTCSIRSVMKAGVLYDGETLNELWPNARPFDASSR